MQAIGYLSRVDHPDSMGLVAFEAPAPEPGPGELRVRIRAIALNPVDVKMLARQPERASTPVVLGWDAAGEVDAVGEGVSGFRPGDRVWYAGAVNRPGCWQQLQRVDHRIVGHMPRTLDFAEAAAMPLTSLTAWEMLFDRLRIDPSEDLGEPLLVIGGSGGVGSLALQLASRIAGLEVVATSGSEAGRAWCLDMGAEHVIDHHGDLVAGYRAQGLPDPRWIFCITHAGEHGPALAELLRPQGAIGFIDDFADAETINTLKRKSAGLHWAFMFTRPLYGTRDMARQGQILDRVAQAVDQGVLRTTLRGEPQPFDLDALVAGLGAVAEGHGIGKRVLLMP
ncbi:MAG: zinc-binding alcohol dehydrogenase family protein [Gammaproteobacteria bacterium]|nr:MAG: zinc-binding alcohol dehydrogenase family protein [Gammaproteobacteria bacterium]